MNTKTASIVLVLAVLLVGGGYVATGYISQDADNDVIGLDDSHDHATHQHDDHDHGTVDISDWDTIPTVDLVVHTHPESGWNLQIVTTNHRFASNDPDHDTTGHAHLYIDGKKKTILNGEWYHLTKLSPGEHEIMVTLSSNEHNDYLVDGKPISDTEIISA